MSDRGGNTSESLRAKKRANQPEAKSEGNIRCKLSATVSPDREHSGHVGFSNVSWVHRYGGVLPYHAQSRQVRCVSTVSCAPDDDVRLCLLSVPRNPCGCEVRECGDTVIVHPSFCCLHNAGLHYHTVEFDTKCEKRRGRVARYLAGKRGKIVTRWNNETG